jgi:hypothetical protein
VALARPGDVQLHQRAAGRVARGRRELRR